MNAYLKKKKIIFLWISKFKWNKPQVFTVDLTVFQENSFVFFLLSLYVLVSFSRVGHGYPRGQKPHQPDVDYQPSEEDHVWPSAQTSVGLRKWT